MDLLFMEDRVGGSLKDGGFRRMRFIKPCRRDRGTTNNLAPMRSDTFFSSVGSGMLMDFQAAPPLKINHRVNETSGSSHPFFLLPDSVPHNPGSSFIDATAEASGSASLYNQRYERESRLVPRGTLTHVGLTAAVLVDCTPRSARWNNGRGSNESSSIRLTRQQVQRLRDHGSGESPFDTEHSSDYLRLVNEMSIVDRKLGRIEGILRSKHGNDRPSTKDIRLDIEPGDGAASKQLMITAQVD